MSLSSSSALDNVECFTTFELASRLWPWPGIEKRDFSREQHAPFCDFVREKISCLHRNPSEFATQTLETTLSLIEDLKEHRAKTRKQILILIGRRFMNVDHIAILRSIELAARLWLTLTIYSEPTCKGPVGIYVSPINWPEDQSLDDLVQGQFNGTGRSSVFHRGSKIDERFTVAFLSKTCGINIYWTNNVADHLKFNKVKKLVIIYQHKICLLHHLESTEEPIIPLDVLEETLDTFELLFPWYNKDTKDLLKEHRKVFYGLGRCGRDRILDMGHYSYWGHRLSELLQAFEEPPTDILQLIRDQRNFNEWATFWIAVLVLVLTVVSIAFGSVATAYSIKQYNLALAQVCAGKDSASQLLAFCA